MKNTDFTETIYTTSLTRISNVNFTRREIDILSCLLSARGTSKIATFLSIAPRTVVTHIRNIMLKLECNSREGIIDFVEKSKKVDILRKYYACLITEQAFEKTLKDIAKLKLKPIQQTVTLYWKDQKLKETLIQFLIPHLKHIGIQGEILENRELNSSHDHLSFSLIEKTDEIHIELIDLTKIENYYLAFFEILQKLFPNKNFISFIEAFRERTQGLQTNSHTNTTERIVVLKRIPFLRYIGVACLALVLVGSGLFYYMYNSHQNTIRSDLVTPFESSLLHRPELLRKIKEKLNNSNRIQAIALVGPGGAGKTTLAREYAHLPKASVVWEVNAETQETLKLSFENLAQSLAKSEQDQKVLRGIQDIKNPEVREVKIIQFIKDHLQAQSNWFLIFDNVEKFSDIKKYFPQDADTWGHGKVILTTRDANIQNNPYVNDILLVGELTSEEKLLLFTKIMAHGNTKSQSNETNTFLEHIPSYPLDVSVAAYYLKSTNVPYSIYLKKLEDYSFGFENIQENLLKEAGDYTKTRYRIISLSLKHLIETHKDFVDLLLLISLVDSQSIPRDLLEHFKGTQVVDNFIYNLKKYSLITVENTSLTIGPIFSIHRSTQNVILSYLMKYLSLSDNTCSIQNIALAIEKYTAQLVDKGDFVKLINIINHLNLFLSHDKLMNDITKYSLMGELGCSYAYLYQFMAAQPILEECLRNLSESFNENHNRISRILSSLGLVYRELGQSEKAKDSLERSLVIYRSYLPENYTGIANSLLRLGHVYRGIGDYEKAKTLYEQRLDIYKKHLSNDRDGIAWTLGSLGIVYKELGNYEMAKRNLEQALTYLSNDRVCYGWALAHLGDVYINLGLFDEAKEHLIKSTLVYKIIQSEDDIGYGWALAHLGNAYLSLGVFDKAQYFLEKALIIYKKNNLSKHSAGFPWALAHLGSTYMHLKNYRKAKSLLNDSLQAYELIFNKDHFKTARVLRRIGLIYLAEGTLDIAENYFLEALAIFKKYNHPDSYKSLENLGELYQRKADMKRAKEYLEHALDIVKANFPKDSPHLKRIQDKLTKL